MAIVTYILRKGQSLTEEQKQELEQLKSIPDEDIIVDDDCPETTDEEWEFYSGLMRKYNTNRVTKEMVLKELADNPAIFQARKLKK